jgi:hypothetical protein
MKSTAREFLMIWAGLIALGLVVEHYTGFSKDVGAIGGDFVGLSKVLKS